MQSCHWGVGWGDRNVAQYRKIQIKALIFWFDTLCEKEVSLHKPKHVKITRKSLCTCLQEEKGRFHFLYDLVEMLNGFRTRNSTFWTWIPFLTFYVIVNHLQHSPFCCSGVPHRLKKWSSVYAISLLSIVKKINNIVIYFRCRGSYASLTKTSTFAIFFKDGVYMDKSSKFYRAGIHSGGGDLRLTCFRCFTNGQSIRGFHFDICQKWCLGPIDSDCHCVPQRPCSSVSRAKRVPSL